MIINASSYRWMALAFVLGLALSVGLAAGCYGHDPLNPKYAPPDSTSDTTPNQGIRLPLHAAGRVLV